MPGLQHTVQHAVLFARCALGNVAEQPGRLQKTTDAWISSHWCSSPESSMVQHGDVHNCQEQVTAAPDCSVPRVTVNKWQRQSRQQEVK